MKQFVGYLIKKAVRKLPRSKKVSPTIKSVKPFTEKRADQFAGIKSKTPEDRANVIRRRESIKRMDQLDNLKKKRKEGIKAGKEMKRMVDTKRAKNIGGTIFSKSIREKKMGGGMMGRRMGYSEGKLAVTPREKRLAAQYGDKKRITRGDVITAAKKKSGNKNV